jgi:hypothetical protein
MIVRKRDVPLPAAGEPFEVLAVANPPFDADHVERVLYALAHDPFPLPTRQQIRAALEQVAEAEESERRGQPQGYGGLAGWLYFLASLPTEYDDATPHDRRIAGVIRRAVDNVARNRATKECRAACKRHSVTRSDRDLTVALTRIVEIAERGRDAGRC